MYKVFVDRRMTSNIKLSIHYTSLYLSLENYYLKSTSKAT